MSHENLLAAVSDAKHSRELGNGHAAPATACRVPSMTLRVLPVECGTVAPLEHTPKDETPSYADTGRKGQRGRATCEPLFTSGEQESDGFSRTFALRYLSWRMVFKGNTRSKGQEDAPKTVLARKTSSVRHASPLYAASEVEDVAQDAYMIFAGMTLGKRGQRLVHLTGNRKHDTYNACRAALSLRTRAKHKERKRLDILAARMHVDENKERGWANRFYDAELEQLLEAVRVHGWDDQKTLAEVIGVSAGELCKRLGRLRESV